jgi:hypothetical protein
MPPRNVYFSHGTRSEKHLLEDILIEAMKIYGHDVYYIPRKIIQMDTILNEDFLSQFDKAFKIEMYVESVDGFEGDGKLVSKFGLEIRDQITVVVSRRRWNGLIGKFGYTENSARPREGDLIYFPMTAGLFEIKWVEDKQPFFQLNNTPTFKLTCELYEYGNQNINTGVPEVDSVQQASSQVWRAYVDFLNDEVHSPDEFCTITLPSGITGSAKFLSVAQYTSMTAASFGSLVFDDGQYHSITVGTTFTGQESETVSTVTQLIDLSDGDAMTFPNDFAAQNSSFAIQGNNFIDFSEGNPFGEPFDF